MDTSQVSAAHGSTTKQLFASFNSQKEWGLLRISQVSPETHEPPFQEGMLAPIGPHRRTFKMEMIVPDPRKQLNYNGLIKEMTVYSSHSWLFTSCHSDKVLLD